MASKGHRTRIIKIIEHTRICMQRVFEVRRRFWDRRLAPRYLVSCVAQPAWTGREDDKACAGVSCGACVARSSGCAYHGHAGAGYVRPCAFVPSHGRNESVNRSYARNHRNWSSIRFRLCVFWLLANDPALFDERFGRAATRHGLAISCPLLTAIRITSLAMRSMLRIAEDGI